MSRRACTVLFCTLNSLITDVPSLYAVVARSCSSRMLAVLAAKVFKTPAARTPSSFMSLNKGASCCRPPLLPKFSNSCRRASLASSLSNFVKSLTSFPAILANLAGSWYTFMMTVCRAVEAISTCCISWSSTEANPMICVCEIPACFPVPDTRAVKSTRYDSAALLFWATSLMALPVASIAPRNPSVLSSPNICASLPIFLTASSPRSSPNATLILSAASTKSRISCFPCIPRRPASCASSFNRSRGVRVSIFLRSSFRSFTASSVIPVYFFTPAIASEICA